MDDLDAKNIPYEVMIKKEEGHGFVLEENRIELYQKMGEFFDKNLAKH
jgi:dipeptidyl aminopeptidase/acylaminoacyl peptidase